MPNLPASHRLRTGRVSEPGRIYLLTTAVHHRQPIFGDWRVGRLVVDQLRRAQEEGLVVSQAWVVMPDHFHWLVELHNGSLTCVMRRVKSCSTLAVNRACRREGRLWQQGFQDRAIRKEENLRAAARYIVANPLRAGLVDRIGDYPLWDAIWL
jgi:REP element-mobilizing transposase RayT